MKDSPYVSTTNACKLCKPLGAALAFKGLEGSVPFLHGSQGCATYMRRYIISHFREPVDIASSALGEKHAIYGGGPNFKKGLLNVMGKYGAKAIGVATTCLTETIGDDVSMLLREFKSEFGDLELPELVTVSTPSYSGTHMEGFHAATAAMADQLVTEKAPSLEGVNIMPGFVSTADMRHIKEIATDFGVPATLLPDYSDTLDGPALKDYEKIPSGGAKISDVKAMSGAAASLEFGRVLSRWNHTAGTSLEERFSVPLFRLGLPIGVRENDAMFQALARTTGRPIPDKYAAQRGRLVDAMVDGHKYLSGLTAVVYGEEDLVVGLCSFLSEIGVRPILAATGSNDRNFEEAVTEVTRGFVPAPAIRRGADFYDIAEEAEGMKPDLIIGHSKGYRYARQWDVPLIRVGFPIHDRFGGQRILHLGYRGAQSLFDTLVNAVLEKKQSTSPVGYGYL